MRTFVLVSHTTPPDGQWPLDDLPGAGGRVDVLARAVTAALCTSHGLRADTQVILVFVADPAAPAAIRFDGASIRKLNPDERSTAARIQQALQARHPDPWWNEVQPGLAAAPYALREVLMDLDGAPLYALDADGTPLGPSAAGADQASIGEPSLATFVLSDHRPFAPDEHDLLDSMVNGTISLGPEWLHGHHCIHILQWWLDRAPGNGV